MSLANRCYLEHGYDKVSGDADGKILGNMEEVVTAIASKTGIEKDPGQYAEELRLRAQLGKLQREKAFFAVEAVAMTARPLLTNYVRPLRRMDTISKRLSTPAII